MRWRGPSWNAAHIDLSGAWRIRHDPLSQGLADQWWSRPPAEGWLNINVPSAWQTVLGAEANGIAWYLRALPDEMAAWAEAGDRVRLGFASVATDCRVWVGDAEIGRHVGDWMPFEFDITDALKRAAQTPQLCVRVDQYHAPRPAKGVVVENGHIAKGFHDVLSIQHAGLWGPAWLRRTGRKCVVPNGIAIDAEAANRSVAIEVELLGDGPLPPVNFEIRDPSTQVVARGEMAINDSRASAKVTLDAPPALWFPDSPHLYALALRVGEHERHTQRFGFRDVKTGGSGNSQILLNGRPLQLRGMLHWGHEPRHIAPAPPAEQIREEFRRLRELGFNCVCLCMFYPPELYYEIADETGMLLWQEHPIWKSRMSPELTPEYQRCYAAFLRRDRRHPSVIIVSATCEHEAYDPELGRWWWRTSAAMLPRTLRQLQTGFLEQTPPDQTDLYDDHVYDNCGRWARFLEDMQARIGELPPRPFVMGETIVSNAWPDIAALREAEQPAGAKGRRQGDRAEGEKRPWWLSRGLDECEALERAIVRRWGAPTLERFKAQGQRFAVEFRKFQAELLRTFPRSAGFVTNSIRDVPICRIGFMDDLDRWRFTPQDTRPWLSDVVLLLETPEHGRALPADQRVACRLGMSNFGAAAFDDAVNVCVGEQERRLRLAARPGEIVWSDVQFDTPKGDRGPRRFDVVADAPGLANNRWTLIALPQEARVANVARLDGLPFGDAEGEPEFEERAYSSGWGLPCRTWRPTLPDPAALAPSARPISAEASVAADVSVLITHRLTPHVHEFLKRGGRCVLLAHRHAGGMRSRWINLWGQLPLLIERPEPHAVIRPGESDAVLAMLHYDLTRDTTRAIAVDDEGLTGHVEPVIRYVWTHDAGTPKCFDAVFSVRVEAGLLVVSCLDHAGAAGGWMLSRLIRFAAESALATPDRELDIGRYVM
ncbi:MAG: glycoside hydrolase family 2 TIM barrel-domain containing protein [Phycisphaerae bacterium]